MHATTRMDSPEILAKVQSYRKCIANAYKQISNTRNSLATLTRTRSQVPRTFSCARAL